MRKIISFITIFALLLALSACGAFGRFIERLNDEGTPPPVFRPEVSGVPTPSAPTSSQANRRDYRVDKLGGAGGAVTIMLFMCGSDLESNGGLATSDILEMAGADISGNINIIIETGGAFAWQNDVISSDTNQRWKLTDGGEMELLEDVGRRDMTDPATLADFISFCGAGYPAGRNILILWDHGGGTLGGYGSDELFPGGGMSLSEIDRALSGAGAVFDIIGFDCCLMGTAETAFVAEKHADYLIASQRSEPGGGWYYTDWISALSADASIGTEQLGRIIVDGFIRENEQGYFGDELTLSMLDLTWVPLLYEEICAYFSGEQDLLLSDAVFMEMSQARHASRSPGEETWDQVDLIYLLENLGQDGAGGIIAALENATVYSRETIDNYHGLSIYFPYHSLDSAGGVLDDMSGIGVGADYRNFLTTFASLMAGGQMYGGDADEPFFGGEHTDWSESEWIDEALIDSYGDYYSENSYDSSELYLEEKGENYVLSLSDDDWNLVTSIYMELYWDDGDGYYYLGADDTYEFDEDGDLIIAFDNTWVALNGRTVSFTAQESGVEGLWYGYVPAYVNGSEVNIVVAWEGVGEASDAYVAGYQPVYEDHTAPRGLQDFDYGDEVEFTCDYYTYGAEYEGSYGIGGFTVDGEISVSYEDVGENDCIVYYSLYDIYGGVYRTEPLIYSAGF